MFDSVNKYTAELKNLNDNFIKKKEIATKIYNLNNEISKNISKATLDEQKHIYKIAKSMNINVAHFFSCKKN